MLPIAVLAVSITAPSGAPLILRYIAACTTLIIVVINAFVGWFAGLIDGVIIGNFRHLGEPPSGELIKRGRRVRQTLYHKVGKSA
jgi:hypothetical protein